MQEVTVVTGLVIKTQSYGEYDKRVVLLTLERGKITCFAKGARRLNSKLMAATGLFAFGQFKVYEGKNAYTLTDAEIDNYFEELMQDFDAAYMGMYFLEIADFYCRENSDDKEMLKLLYQSLRALTHKRLPNELVRCIYEIKSIVVNGEFPGYPEDSDLLEATLYTIQYIVETDISKLYTFQVSEQVQIQLTKVCKKYCKTCMDKEFKSLVIMNTIT